MGTVRQELQQALHMTELALLKGRSKVRLRLYTQLAKIYIGRALRKLEKQQMQRKQEQVKDPVKAGKERVATKLMPAKAGRKAGKPVRKSSPLFGERPLRGKPLKRGGAKPVDSSVCRKFEPSRRDRNYCAHCGAHKNAPHPKPPRKKKRKKVDPWKGTLVGQDWYDGLKGGEKW
jgi:hypothetical protein